MNVIRNAAVLTIASLALAGCGDDGGDGSGTGGNGGGSNIDACAIITQQDATALFGVEATRGNTAATPGMVAHCDWEWDSDTAAHGLTFSVWDGEGYYSAPSDSQPYTIGEKGYIKANDAFGVNIMWVQNGLVPDLYYFTVGSSLPAPTTKTEQMKTLAQKASAALP